MGFDKVTVEEKEPTSTPPEPVKVKAPPEDGIPPVARLAPYEPLIPSCKGSGIAGPVEPAKVLVPADPPRIHPPKLELPDP